MRTARARWENSGIDTYGLTVRPLCECNLTDSVRIVVEDDVDIAFDATYGFPTLISIDWAADYVDDEIVYRTEGFTAKP